MREWSLQEVSESFSAIVDAARAGEPQRVSLQGQPVVVVLAEEEYERLRGLEREGIPTFGQLLLQMPQDDGEFERLSLSVRCNKE